ncbi:MAG: Carboxypeptidase regulatory-like domain [Chloroflexota bacterium]|nr:Carboxypeptidase regulatory-like domain [Chloroflexota bacterium]
MTLTASAPGYTTSSDAVTVQPGKVVEGINPLLARTTGGLSGFVLEGDLEANTATASIVRATVTAAGQSAISGSDGSFSFASLPAGPVTLTATAAGFESGSASVTIEAGKVSEGYILVLARTPSSEETSAPAPAGNEAADDAASSD